MFGTALNYVVLRILGVDKHHPVMTKARATLHRLGELPLDYAPLHVDLIHCDHHQVVQMVFLPGESSGSQHSMFMTGLGTIPSLPSSGKFDSDNLSDLYSTEFCRCIGSFLNGYPFIPIAGGYTYAMSIFQ